MLDFFIKLFAHAIFNSATGRIEPVRPEVLEIDYADPESMLHAAARLDQNGEWDGAIFLLEHVAQNWPDDYGDYARNCIAGINQKKAMA